MTLLQQIKQAQLTARKQRQHVATALLTTLIGEAEAVGKNAGNRETTDSEVIAVIKKFLKNNEETRHAAGVKYDDKASVLNEERQILESFLPEQLNFSQLERVIEEIVKETEATTLRHMGAVMKLLKERYDGQYDGTMASSIIKHKLQ